MPLEIIKHPAAVHYINQLRRKDNPPHVFRRYCDQVTTFLALAATSDLRTKEETIETPLETMEAAFINEQVVVVAILRAGAGMIDCIVRLLPEVSVGYIGLERNEDTAEARRYYCKFPPLEGARVLVVDPMLATGGSSEQAIEAVFEAGAQRVDFLCIVAAPEGVQRLESRFPGLRIFCGALDRELDANKYIRPGLGDFGDRLYGT
ncbi:MAG: uracil phosphoribosyltransferase [Puniceicoccaceae bacterium]